MKTFLAATAVLLLCFSLSAAVLAQSTVGTMTGIVTDSSKAALPGVSVKVLNEDTGVSQSMLTNDSGSFSFILPPGSNYTITAELQGFRKATFQNVPLRMSDSQRVDFTLEVGDIQQSIIVDTKKTNPLLDLPSIGTQLDEIQLQGLPLVGNDPLALITTLPGYRASPLGHEYDTVGGLPMYMMNTVRDGLSVTDGFSPGGVGSNTILNPDMISEIRLILAPVDAEAGRGNGQVQITTKSGTNKFTWNINYNLRQNALNALGPNSSSRLASAYGAGTRKQPFGATFQYTVSVGGPIWKNHTFYFVNWDHQMRWERAAAAVLPGTTVGFTGSGGYLAVPVLTDPARNGIFRYFDGWGSITASTARPTAGATNPTGEAGLGGWPIDIFKMPDGRDLPVAPLFYNNSNTTPYQGTLKCYSVFGNVKFDGSPFNPAVDCGQYIQRTDNGAGGSLNNFWVPDTANPVYGVGILPDPSLHPNFADPLVPGGIRVSWDQASRLFDRPPDRTGYVQHLLAYMPRVNSYISASSNGGQVAGTADVLGNDGLNKANHAWVRGTTGVNNQNTFRGGTFGVGTGLDQSLVNHKIVNLKIDHNIGNSTRLSMSTSFQNDQNSRLYYQSRWPEGANGYAARVPRVFTLNGITTVSNSMVNEARFGVNYNRSTQLAPWDNPDGGRADFARSFLSSGWIDPNNGEVSPIYFLPGRNNTWFDWSDNILPYGLNGANAGLQANNGYLFTGGPTQSGCSPTGVNSDNGDTESAVNCETGSALYNFADTFSWNRGRHAIRAGGELRLTRANELSGQTIPQATGGGPAAGTAGATDLLTIGTLAAPTISEMAPYDSATGLGRLQNAATRSGEMLYVLSASVASVNQTFWVNNLDNFRNGTWETWSSPGDSQKSRRTVQNEYAVFLKDDWKITKNLTLNLGVRYENYGNLYIKGFANGILGDGYGLFGAARTGRENVDPFDYWLRPGTQYYTGYGKTPPSIDVTGTFLPNGQPNYIPGSCPLNTITMGTLNSATPGNSGASVACTSVGGPGIQFVPNTYVPTGGTSTNNFTTAANCVWGVQQVSADPSLPSLLPVSNCDPSLLTSRVFVGPGSDHPDQAPLYRDRNNIGPAIGFSYRLPLGGRTVLVRGGFQFTYGSAGRDRSIGSGSAGQLTQNGGGGATFSLDQITRTCTGATQCLGTGYTDTNHALILADVPNLIPLQTQMYADPQYLRPAVGVSGGGSGALAKDRLLLVQNWGVQRLLSATGYAPGYQDPRTENYTFSVSTNLTRASTVAMSYVGTLGRNRPTGVNLNMPNVYHNPELLDALNVTRAGGYAPLFDQMFAGFNLTTLAATSGWGPVGSCAALVGALAFSDPVNNISCPVNTVYQSGSDHLRNASAAGLAQGLANGNYLAVANILATMSPATGGNTTFPLNTAATGNRSTNWGGFMQANLLRNGCDRLAMATSTYRSDLIGGNPLQGNMNVGRCFPEDYMVINPSLNIGNGTNGGSSTSGQGAVYKDNWGYTNYHQFQVQYTLRLGSANLQATYLTSKTLALPRDFYKTNTFNSNALGGVSLGSTTGFSDPLNEETRQRDYGESSDSLKHAMRLNGVFQLPFGPGKPLLSKAPRWVTMILGGWQMGIIYNGQSGQPFSIIAGDMMYGSSASGLSTGCDAYAGVGFTAATSCGSGLSFPDIVSPLWTNPTGKMHRDAAGVTTYFGNPSPFSVIPDPQCTNGAAVSLKADRVNSTPLASSCALRALVMKVQPGTPGAFPLSATDPTPVLIMLQNPLPGHQGSLGGGTMRQPGRYFLDANLVKTFMFTETRGIQIRLDATNVMNHPTPSDLYLNLAPSTTSVGTIIDRFNTSSPERSAFASGCNSGNVACGRQVQFGIRMIN